MTATAVFKSASDESAEVADAPPEDMERLLDLTEEPVPPDWGPIRLEAYLERPTDRRVDLPAFGSSRLLVLREPGFNVLGELLLSCGEFLPVDSSDRLWLFHPTVWAEAVDIDRSDIVRFPSSGRVMTIPKLVFAEEKLPDVPAFVLVPTRQLYFRSSFVDAVIRNRLTGRRFVQV